MSTWLILPAAGSGERMQSTLPKQFTLLKNKPVIIHTLEKFISAMPQIQVIIALDKKYFDWIEQNKLLYSVLNKVRLVEGGETRFESVKNALSLIPNGFVAIHDAVRPLVSEKLIVKAFETANDFGNAVPTVLLKESIRKIINKNSSARPRELYRIVQTPQVFSYNQLKSAYNQPYKSSFTDDASVVESAGYQINLIDGEENNIKLTYPIDFKLAELLV